MPTPIRDYSELQQLTDALAKHGLHVPGDVKTVEQLVHNLLVGCKTRAATERLRDEREERKRASKRRDRDGNPDAPSDDDEDETLRRVASAMQMSTGADVPNRAPVDDADRAKVLVDLSERHQKNPNFTRDPFAS